MTVPALPVVSAKTDPGLVRDHNEDACFYNLSRKLFAISDGMGGAAGGEVASSMFMDIVAEDFAGWPSRTVEKSRKRIRDCFGRANSAILKKSFIRTELQGMGCTAEILNLIDDRFVIGHVGDSRTYRFRDGNLVQLTTDHSLVQRQVDEGIIREEERNRSRVKNVLLRAIGIQLELTVDIRTGSALPGDIFLLCTDGLHNLVTDEEISAVLGYDGPLDLKTEMLVNMANDAGGTDNITVMLIQLPERNPHDNA